MATTKCKKGANVLLKFIDEKFIDSTFENGLYFNTLEAFKKSDGLSDEQADSDEGASIRFDSHEKGYKLYDKNFNYVAKLDGKEIINSKLSKHYSFAAKVPICCLALLKFPYDFEFIRISNQVREYKIEDKVINKLNGISGSRPFIYCLEQEMYRCLRKTVDDGRKIIAQKVSYYRRDGMNISEDEVKKTPYKVIFMKNEKYRNQKEFRIALVDKKESCYLKLDELFMEKSNNLNNIRLRINPKYDEITYSIQLCDKSEEIIYKVEE